VSARAKACGRPGGGVDGALHARISADLAREIQSGAWPAGHRIPFEHELMATYGCARATANKAVQALAAAGLVERRRRAGSFVARPPLQSAVLRIPELQAEVTGRGQAYGYALTSRRRRRPDPRDPNEAALASAAWVLELACRHFADSRPFALEERIISLAAAPQAEAADFETVAPGAWLLGHVPWNEAEHRIGAVAADPRMAEGLDLKPGEACLTLRRWTWRSGEAVTFARQTFPARAFEVVARFSPTTFG
jgi:GntR family histidine utilization transcriptional repressor